MTDEEKTALAVWEYLTKTRPLKICMDIAAAGETIGSELAPLVWIHGKERDLIPEDMWCKIVKIAKESDQ